MFQSELKDGTIWFHTTDFSEAANKVKELKDEGYSFLEPIGNAILMKKDKTAVITYLEYYAVIEKIEDLYQFKKDVKIIYPNYEDTILNSIGTVKEYFRGVNRYKTEQIVKDNLDGIKHVFFLILDGLGSKFIEILDSKLKFLNKYKEKDLTSIYPSTTAAATTAMKNGLTPIETAWLGWSNYVSEIDRSVVMFRGSDYQTNEENVFNMYDILPYKPFYDDLDINGYMIEPDFSNPARYLRDILDRVRINLNKDEENVMYAYYPNPDHMFHVYGTDNKFALDSIVLIDKLLEEFRKTLRKDTLLIVSADHGHINADNIKLKGDNYFYNMLARDPQNEGRCTFFKVKDEYKNEFPIIFNSLFKDNFKLYTKEEIIKLNYLGINAVHPRALDFMGDYVSLATNHSVFKYSDSTVNFISHHAGITEDEMRVPLIIFRGEK